MTERPVDDPVGSAVRPGPMDACADDLGSLPRLALGSVALAILIALVSSPLYFAAFGWDVEAAIFGDPSALLGAGPSAAVLLRWGALGDMVVSVMTMLGIHSLAVLAGIFAVALLAAAGWIVVGRQYASR